MSAINPREGDQPGPHPAASNPVVAFHDFVTGLHETARRVFTGLPAVYGLAGDDTPRALGEWALTDDRASRLGLLYGDIPGAATIIQVHTTALPPQVVVDSFRYGDTQPGTAFDGPSGEDEMPWFRRWEHSSTEHDIELRVGGRPVPFASRTNGDTWYACATLPDDGPGLIVEAVHARPEDLDIIRITDPEPYLRGHRLMLRAAWRP